MRNDIGLFQSRTREFAGRLESARKIILDAFALKVPGYISLSGGKDSTVVYDLVKSVDPEFPVVWKDNEWDLPETIEYLNQIDNLIKIARSTHHTDWFTTWEGGPETIPEGTIWAGAPKDTAHSIGRKLFNEKYGFQLVFLGLRQDESNTRRMSLRMYGPLHYTKSDETWHCNPIHNWSWRDVWAYIVSRGIDYNKAYDRLEELGIPPEQQRIGPLAQERVLEYGQIVILKRGWPDLYNRFVAKYPEARQYN